MTSADGLDVEATFATYRALVERDAPGAMPLARRTWVRLGPQRWPLEWHLPLWLGDAFGLDLAIARRIVTSNVLGLASVRLADDLADGEIDPVDRSAAANLAAVLYDAAVEPYRELLGSDARFWRRLDAWMAEARRGAGRGQLTLAGRGAPLKVSAFAVCDLTGRGDAFADVERCLDHALAALVLYDDACDWREDLAAGRPNALAGGRSEARVLGGILAGSIGPYFERIDREVESAIAVARRHEIGGLATWLLELRVSFDREARRLETRYGDLGNAAVRLLFGSA